MTLLPAQVADAKRSTPWDLSNKVLYDLCSANPRHTALDAVLAKVLMIGRVYAAAIERRKSKTDQNDAYYLGTVSPTIAQSDIDSWIDRARSVVPGTPEGSIVLTEVHARTTGLFKEISKLDNRSLASKYLHFHVPGLFFILDSRAIQGMSKVSSIVGRASRTKGHGDNHYRRFAEKCHRLQVHCSERFGMNLTPRELDNLLLWLSKR